MIFDNEMPIDDNLLSLVKSLKKLTVSNPDLKWIASAGSWYIQISDWLSIPISITYTSINKNKFAIFIYSANDYTELGHVNYPSQVSDSLELLKYQELGLSIEIIKHLSKAISTCTLKTAIKNIMKFNDLVLSNEDLEILKIEKADKTKVFGKRFGL